MTTATAKHVFGSVVRLSLLVHALMVRMPAGSIFLLFIKLIYFFCTQGKPDEAGVLGRPPARARAEVFQGWRPREGAWALRCWATLSCSPFFREKKFKNKIELQKSAVLGHADCGVFRRDGWALCFSSETLVVAVA